MYPDLNRHQDALNENAVYSLMMHTDLFMINEWETYLEDLRLNLQNKQSKSRGFTKIGCGFMVKKFTEGCEQPYNREKLT